MMKIILAVFYFMASMTCTWNIIEKCCSSKNQTHHHEENHHHGNAHDHAHSDNHSHDQNSQKKPDPENSKLCCDKLLTSLKSSFKFLHKVFLIGFKSFEEIPNFKYFVARIHFWIHSKDPPYSIRGRPLYKIFYSIHAPPSRS